MNKNKIMKFIIIIGVLIIPVMYSFFYLKAFWDPYGNIKDIKVAVVNLDNGTENENLGKELVNELKENEKIGFVFLDNQEEARKGLENEKFYATITIPEDFSKELNTAKEENKVSTSITYSPNQKYNYLASQIINQVTREIEKNLRAEVSKKVTKELADNIKQVPEQMMEISNGTEKLQSGSKELEKGLQTLNKGTEDLEKNYKAFNNGVNSAYLGSNNLDYGISELNKGIEQVYAGSEQLENSTKEISKISDGVSQLKEGSNKVSSGAEQYVDTINNTIDKISTLESKISTLGKDIELFTQKNPELLQDNEYKKIISDLEKIQNSNIPIESANLIKEKGNELKQGTKNLKEGINNFANNTSKLNELNNGINTLTTGIGEIRNGANQVKEGSNSLNHGIKELNVSSNKIYSGVQELNSGTSSAVNGSNELNKGINTFEKEILKGTEEASKEIDKLDGLEEYVKNPVEIKEEDYGKVNSYGVGFAPYFISISLWVGALVALVMFYGDEERFKLLGKNASNKIIRTLIYLGISAVQGIVLGFLLKLGLGFEVTNIWLYYGTMILIGLVFMSIEQLLIMNFKDIGKFLCILLLVLQLAASAGTFPIETVPKFFQNIYNFMPMNYTIRLIKESIVQINMNTAIKNIGILLGIFGVFTIITVIIEKIKKHKRCKEVVKIDKK